MLSDHSDLPEAVLKVLTKQFAEGVPRLVDENDAR
jgi:hypothetical protein